MDGLVVLVANAVWGDLFAWHGAEVYTWMMGPGPMPSGYPPVFVPHLTDLQRGNERAHQLRAMIQERSQVRLHIDAARVQRAAVYLSDLPALMDAMGEYDEASERGRVLLRRCTYTPGTPSADGHTPWHLPPPQCADPNAELRQRCMEGIRQRYGGNEPAAVRARLAYELDIFTKKGFAVYILAVWNLTRHRQTCGRGSAASSLVCYALGITNVDPLKYHLVFERFMSEERFDPPDIDVDFAHDERDAVLQETIATFGRDHVALVSTHQTLHAQGAWRQAANVLGKERAATTAAQRELTLKRQFAVGSGPGEDWEAVQDAADALLGTPTHFGVHCGGIIITRDPIREMVPIHPAAKQLNGMPAPAIAWEKDGAEQLGLVKIDFLGNRSLGVVRDVLADLRDDGVSINEWKWEPEEDLLARQIISRGLTIGCFYIESPAMRLLNAKAGVTDFDRLTLHSSIIRPAANSWINTYLERFTEFRKTGQQRDEWYPHPALRALLSESFGILSYQEDLMLISRDLAGFSIKQQNQLRKALGRSDTPQRLASLKGDFLAGCEAHAVSRDVTALVWDMIVSFAGYSFTKAHSASYVKVSFQAACLKVHNPAHFMARVISNGGGFYGPCAYVEEARRRKVEILSPCVVVGEWETKRASHHALRIGFQLLRGVRRSTIARIMRQRERRPFVGACDLWRRCHPSPSEMEALLWSGALDALLAHITPAQRYWLIAYALQQPRSTDHGEPDQLEFDFAADTKVDPIPPSDLSPLCQRTLDRHAWNALGVLPRAHPFALWDLPMQRPWRCADVQPAMKGRTVTVMAWVVTSKAVIATQLRGRDGSALASPSIRPMAFVTLEDECGIAESVWFPETYQRYGPVIDAGIPFQVTGRIQVEYGVATLEVHRIDSHFRDLHT
jgi:DNA polymerase III alpha subunit